MGISYKFTNNLIVLVHSQYTHKLSFTINKAVTELSHTRHLRDRGPSCETRDVPTQHPTSVSQRFTPIWGSA